MKAFVQHPMINRASVRGPAVALAIMLFPVVAAGAQAPTSASPRQTAPVRAWVSLGLGPAGYYQNGGTTAGRAAANVTVGRAAVLLRTSITGDGIDGYETASETSLLGGLRFGGAHFYAIPAVGMAKSHWDNGYPCQELFVCSAAQAQEYTSDTFGFTYDIGAHASARGVGLAINLSVVTNPAKGFFSALTLSPEFGRIGR